MRGRATNPRTGKQTEVRLTVLEGDAAGAYARLQAELKKVREGQASERPAKTRFKDFAVSLLARKVATGEIKSAKTRVTWGTALEHHLFPEFGDFFVNEIRRADVEAWKGKMAAKVRADDYSPVTVNGWLAILRVILNTAVAEFELGRNPVAGFKPLDTSTHHTYTEEEPNALTVEEVREYLACMRERYPQFFALVALGFGTGLRPSSLRPMRRQGPTPDILWDEGVLLVRRSQAWKREVMETTKTKRHQRLTLPPELVEILRWHVARLPEGPMRESELLFPSRTGGFHTTTVLDKPFREVAKAIGLKKKVTPRAMRRTFQDLARAADVRDVVTRAVSGHATEAMQRHYSTVSGEEMRASLAKVIDLAGVRQLLQAEGGAVEQGQQEAR